MLLRGLECKSENVTNESQEDITCDSLKDVTWSQGTHDVRDLSGRSDGSRMITPHQRGQKRMVMSGPGVLLPWFRNK